ncbi:MAG: DUF427 domain-containing protein [Pseudomonadota bacterium]
MAKAVWKDVVIAESETFEIVESNVYFPPESVKRDHLRESDRATHCPWKGDARYYSIVVGDAVNENAAWYYPEPKDKAVHIKDHVAFWNGVVVTR